MRGLNIRVAYANALIGRSGEPENRVAIAEALWEAGQLGIADFHEGECVAPAMFADVPDLLGAWNDGYRSAMIEAWESEAWRLAEQV